MPKQIFSCQMVGYDVADEWTEIETYEAYQAADEYAERCDQRSGGEMLNRPQDREVVRVKVGDGPVREFEITAEYSKNFYVHELDVVTRT